MQQKSTTRYWLLLLVLIAVVLALHTGFSQLGLPLSSIRWGVLAFAGVVGVAIEMFMTTPNRLIESEAAGWAIGFFLIVSGATVPVSDVPLISGLKWGALVVQVIALVYLGGRILGKYDWERLFIFSFALFSAIVALCFLILLLGQNPLWPQPVYIQNRFAGLSNPNSIGVVMALNGAMGLWMAEYFSSRSQSLRWVVIVLFLCSVIGLYLTGSRSSALGFLGGAAIWAWATRRSTLIVLVAVLGTAFFLTTDPAPVSPSMSGSSSYRIQDPQMTQFRLDEPLKTREEVWNESYESWKERLWFGYGYGLTGKTFTLRSLTSAVGAVRDGSGYLGLLESIGAVGAASLLFVYVIVLRYVWQGVRLWRQGYRHLEVWLLLMAGTVFVALIINGGGEPWMIGPGSFMHTFLWFSVAGVLAARSLFFTNVLDSPSPAASKTAQASS